MVHAYRNAFSIPLEECAAPEGSRFYYSRDSPPNLNQEQIRAGAKFGDTGLLASWDLSRIDRYSTALGFIRQLPECFSTIAATASVSLCDQNQLVCLPENIGEISVGGELNFDSLDALTGVPDSFERVTCDTLKISSKQFGTFSGQSPLPHQLPEKLPNCREVHAGLFCGAWDCTAKSWTDFDGPALVSCHFNRRGHCDMSYCAGYSSAKYPLIWDSGPMCCNCTRRLDELSVQDAACAEACY